MENKIRIKELLFVIPIGIIINFVFIKFFSINNIIFQALMVGIIFIILTVFYRKVIQKIIK